MKAYYVEYKMFFADSVKGIGLLAKNKQDAYTRATYDEIPKSEGSTPYSAWVASVTYSNGKTKVFNTFEGNPY